MSKNFDKTLGFPVGVRSGVLVGMFWHNTTKSYHYNIYPYNTPSMNDLTEYDFVLKKVNLGKSWEVIKNKYGFTGYVENLEELKEGVNFIKFNPAKIGKDLYNLGVERINEVCQKEQHLFITLVGGDKEKVQNYLNTLTGHYTSISVEHFYKGFTGSLFVDKYSIVLCKPPVKDIKTDAIITYEEDTCGDHVLCPSTGKKLHPTTLLPIENSVDFTNIKIL